MTSTLLNDWLWGAAPCQVPFTEAVAPHPHSHAPSSRSAGRNEWRLNWPRFTWCTMNSLLPRCEAGAGRIRGGGLRRSGMLIEAAAQGEIQIDPLAQLIALHA